MKFSVDLYSFFLFNKKDVGSNQSCWVGSLVVFIYNLSSSYEERNATNLIRIFSVLIFLVFYNINLNIFRYLDL